MEREKVINYLIRFMKDENIYKTFVNALKYYYQMEINNSFSLYDYIYNSSFRGEYVYNLFEWCFRLHIIKMKNNHIPTYFSIKDADRLGKLYTKKWEKYRKKIKWQ